MKMNIFLLGLCLNLVLINCSVDENLRYINYQEIDNDEFGKTLIDTLQLHVKSGDGLGKFVDMMRDLEGQVEDEQKDDDVNNRQFQKKCDEDLSQSETDLNNISLSITEKQSKLDELNNEKQKKQQMRDAKNAWFKQLNDQLELKKTARAQENKKYEEEINENSYVLYVITEVKKKFINEDGISLIELNNQNDQNYQLYSDLEDQLADAVDESKNFRQNKQYQNLFSLLVQITAHTKGNSEGLQRLKELNEQLLLNVSDNMSLLRTQEDKTKDIFEKESAAIQKDINTINNDLAQIDAVLAALDNKIDMSNNDLEDFKARKSNRELTKKDRYEECQLSGYNYKQSREDNDKKRSLVSQVIGLFSANQREFKEYLHLREQA